MIGSDSRARSIVTTLVNFENNLVNVLLVALKLVIDFLSSCSLLFILQGDSGH
jgi:hypothetical protein